MKLDLGYVSAATKNIKTLLKLARVAPLSLFPTVTIFLAFAVISLGSLPASGAVAASVAAAQPSITEADSIWVVVNKGRPLNPISYAPKHLKSPKFINGSGIAGSQKLEKVAAEALVQLALQMKTTKSGTLTLNSGYRSFRSQVAVHDKDVALLGLKLGERLAARPGYSEHQTGLAADVSAVGQGCVIRECFGKTKAGRWIRSHAWKFGFILRYPLGQTPKTGYQYEPWHLRYVGIELATDMHLQGQTVLEDYWGLPYSTRY